MSASVPVLAPAFAPDERPEPDETAKAKAKEGRTRTGRHEPIRSSTPRIAARGAVLGLTVAAGVAGGGWLRHELDAGLVAGAQLGSVAAGMAFAGAWAERRRMTRIAGTLSDLAVELANAGVPDREAAPKLLAVPGADRVALEAATRRAVDQPGDDRRAVRLLSRVAVLRTLL
jgi:hypothetical protein